MSDGIRIRIDGASEVSGALRKAEAQAANPRGLYEAIGLSLVTSTQARFESGVGPDGAAWPPSIRALAEGGKTLIDSGRLMNSLTFEASDTGVLVGTNVLYAAAQQLGATIRPVAASHLTFRIGEQWISVDQVTIPARPFLGVDAEDEAEIVALVGDWLLGPLGANDGGGAAYAR
jgi:phage virion morphogenesis protein